MYVKSATKGSMNMCLINPKKHEVLDILPDRSIESLSGYFAPFSNRNTVKYVAMDMNILFRSMARSCFPNAWIVSDKYHVYRQVQWVFEDVRKQVQKGFGTKRRKSLSDQEHLC